jgi:hypothetical protein
MKKTLTPIDPDIPLLEDVTYATHQRQYLPLPTRRSDDGDVVTRWCPNFWARLALLFGADIYLTVLTFGSLLQPVRVSLEKPEYSVVEMPERGFPGPDPQTAPPPRL